MILMILFFFFTPKSPKMVHTFPLGFHFSTFQVQFDMRLQTLSICVQKGYHQLQNKFSTFLSAFVDTEILPRGRCMITPFEGRYFFIHFLHHGFYVDYIIILERRIARNSSKYFVQHFQTK